LFCVEAARQALKDLNTLKAELASAKGKEERDQIMERIRKVVDNIGGHDKGIRQKWGQMIK
jgi:hypothetical protein